MKNLLLTTVFALLFSCAYDNIEQKAFPPPQISEPLLVGSWKMITNSGVDVSFDIVELNGKSWTKNTILRYKGVSTVLNDDVVINPITEPLLKSPAGSIQLQMWAVRNNTDIENEVSFYSLQPNHSFNQLTGQLGYANVFGLDSTNSLPPLLDTITFKSPIIINKIK
jgi:hypothetical protein